jgi:hypothetical protein
VRIGILVGLVAFGVAALLIDPYVFVGWVLVFLIFVVDTVRVGAKRSHRKAKRQATPASAVASPPSPKPVERGGTTGGAVNVIREREIIERQVLVMRCPYCKELTPVDLSDCRSCGARIGN